MIKEQDSLIELTVVDNAQTARIILTPNQKIYKTEG